MLRSSHCVKVVLDERVRTGILTSYKGGGDGTMRVYLHRDTLLHNPLHLIELRGICSQSADPQDLPKMALPKSGSESDMLEIFEATWARLKLEGRL